MKINEKIEPSEDIPFGRSVVYAVSAYGTDKMASLEFPLVIRLE